MKNMKRIISAVLCLCMILAATLILTSCKENEKTPAGDEGISVFVAAKDIEEGTKITEDMLKTIKTDLSNIPFNAIRDIAKIKDMITTQKIYAGEFFFAAKLTEKIIEVDDEFSANLVVTEHIKTGGDVADKIQSLINKNPGRTLEFPDGEYIVSKPIKVPADCAKGVSLRLSAYAVIKAANNFSGDAVICLADGERNSESADNSFYLSGGIIDGNGKADVAVSVGDARDILISNVSIRNADVGIKVVKGAADLENIHIKGTDSDNSIGLLIEGDEGSAANIQISNVETGVKVTGANNIFKSVFARYSGSSVDSCGFVDEGAGSNYDMCQSYQFATGFKMSENSNSVYYACYVTWTDSSAVGRNWAFQSAGKFNALIRNCSVDFAFSGHDASLIKVGTSGGKGQILYPMIGGKSNIVNNEYNQYMQGTSVISKD